MTGLATESQKALEPVRRALRAAAEKQAAELRDSSGRQANELLADARAEAAEILGAAAKEGGESARSEAVLLSARVRRQAHELVLAQRNSLRLELHRGLREAVRGLTSDPRYTGLMDRLTARCRELLGPDVVVSTSPDGGVVAEAGSRRLDLSLPLLAEMTLDAMPEVSELWTR
ncbi:vacuolar-type H+-ATPase subunit E/Vma4 [Arthrobacter sp. UYCu512]|uniref:hypothetical protein n=1 Tax=Arthrobacter sp. UYCu512 TaxID=3156338 RepID=UPI00339B4546